MTSPTPEGALAIERARGDDRAQIRAEGFRAGLEAAATFIATGEGTMWQIAADCIRSLPIPEMPDEG